MASIEISPVEVLALKKLSLVVGALAKSFDSPTAKRETTALLTVLMDVAARAGLG